VRTHRLEIQNRLLQQNLRESESRFRQVLENAADVIFQVDMETGAVEYVSPSCREVLGLSPEEVRERGARGLLKLVELPEAERLLHVGEQDLRNAELRFRNLVRGSRWLSINASVVRDPAGNCPRTVVGSARDVTDLRRMKEREREYRQALDRAKRMQSLAVLAGGVAHDLNNILMPILSLPGVIRDEIVANGQPVPASLDEDLAVISRSGQRAASLARDLLSLSRSEFPERRPMPINLAIASVLESGTVLESRRAHPQVRLELSLSSREPLIYGSETHLFQAILNLVVNAFEAMPEGGTLRISTDTYRLSQPHVGHERIEPGEYVRLVVADTGHGIAPEAKDRIFEPFLSRKKKANNSGLGLAVVYGVTKGHEGFVDLCTEMGKGSEFRLFFPVCDEPLPVAEPEEEEVVGGDESILLVDDEEIPREMAARMLRQLGYRVELAESGREAVERIASTEDPSPYALVLLDMVMEEDFDGLDTYRVIARIRPYQRCVLISGFSDGKRVREAQGLGAGGFLQKPFSIQQLGRIVRNEIDAGAATADSGLGERP
jgi:PAS domain S-box-containing protein